uniref:RING-type domain-containing protein n=1 Tax=Psilocybe cubensis TaxID=181762 RepID=A0A8H7Y7Z3_PSICU
MFVLELVVPIGLGFSFLWQPVLAYIPASPTNSTHDAIAGGLNITDISSLRIQWYSNGSYFEHVSYQLAGNDSKGISKGALVHFSEEMADTFTAPTLTPWIALVSCDKNATNASMEVDIFTLARDKGAVSALLFSLYSTACVINREYSDPATFDQVFDIFSTQSSTSSHLIEYQFGQLSANKSLRNYNSAMLNNSANDIQRSINEGVPVSPGYLLTVLQAYNAIDNTSGPGNPTSDATSAGTGNNPPNTALAMIILYAITGCVSALFCIVIISGAIRAIRHPERYGPRARMGGDGGPPQSRARGLTRAILDTFPIVKFGSNQAGPSQSPSSPRYPLDKDSEVQSSSYNIEMGAIPTGSGANTLADAGLNLAESSSCSAPGSRQTDQEQELQDHNSSGSRDIPNSHSLSALQNASDNLASRQRPFVGLGEGTSRDIPPESSLPAQDDVVPASIGRETCPICIVDFEEGDDIRVLPCEGKHCFHQNCVDPWLLKLSSSCPICRHDFLALEHMIAGHEDDEHDFEQGEIDEQVPHARGNGNRGRFSRYLRFAHRRQRRRRGDEADPTDPYMPTAPSTSMYSGM